MKKLGMFVAVVASLCYFLPVTSTLSFLTSEKSYLAPISLGTNEDIFQTETQSIRLETTVTKNITVKREKQSDGTTKESQQTKTSVSLGSQMIIFVPQRTNLTLAASNLTVEGLPMGAVQVEAAKLPDGSQPANGFVFRIAQSIKSVELASSIRKGELHVQALGGFYHTRIPITLVVKYNEDTAVEEIEPPTPSPVDENKPPSEDTKLPVDESKPSSDDTKPPVDESKPPSEDTKPPVDESKPSSEESKPPGEENKPPSNDVQPAASSLAVFQSAPRQEPHANTSSASTANSDSSHHSSDSAAFEEAMVQEAIPSVISRISSIVLSQGNPENSLVPQP